ncbi:MAG: hypothetical protein JWL61_4969 [Gemmatimonadetes bacterium]|nr:hypothetical protein [Gemmatimonadota bacterium]
MPSIAVERYHNRRRKATRLLNDAIAEEMQANMRVSAARVYREWGEEDKALGAEKAGRVWADRAESLFDAAVHAEATATTHQQRDGK